jgi:hypothetical protein
LLCPSGDTGQEQDGEGQNLQASSPASWRGSGQSENTFDFQEIYAFKNAGGQLTKSVDGMKIS